MAVVPTFNEEEALRKCVESLKHPSQTTDEIDLRICVANAGRPLSHELSRDVHDLYLPETHFWTASTKAGIDWALNRKADYVLLANADTVFKPGSVPKLLERCQTGENIIACSPVYEVHDGQETLLYSHQAQWGFLLYGKIIRQPPQAMEIELTGGQGVLIPTHLIQDNPLDPERLPQYAGDHDLWLQLRKRGAKLWLEPESRVLNERGFGLKKQGRSAVGSLLWRMTSINSPDSIKTMWRLRRKHLGFVLGLISTTTAFELRWTFGLPGILRRAGLRR